MDSAAIDYGALALALAVALVITASLGWADRGAVSRRSWLTAAALGVALLAIGVAELLLVQPREVHMAAVLIGVPLPVLGALGLVRATRRMRPWLRWPVIYLVTLALLFVGLLVGAAVLPKYLGG